MGALLSERAASCRKARLDRAANGDMAEYEMAVWRTLAQAGAISTAEYEAVNSAVRELLRGALA